MLRNVEVVGVDTVFRHYIRSIVPSERKKLKQDEIYNKNDAVRAKGCELTIKVINPVPPGELPL